MRVRLSMYRPDRCSNIFSETVILSDQLSLPHYTATRIYHIMRTWPEENKLGCLSHSSPLAQRNMVHCNGSETAVERLNGGHREKKLTQSAFYKKKLDKRREGS